MRLAPGILTAAPLGEAWHDFYLLAGTAAVTLVGLLFVALSLHVEILFRDEHGDFRALATIAFQGYLYVLITALFFLLPMESARWQAWAYAAINLVMLARTLVRAPAFFAARRSRGVPAFRSWRFFTPAIAYALGIVAALQISGGRGLPGVTLLVPVLMMLMAATRTAWELLEYVGRVKGAARGLDG